MTYCSVVPKEIVDFYKNDFSKNPVGTGLFKLKLWEKGNKLILEKNQNYFEKDGNSRLPYLDAVNISFVKDHQTVLLQFLKHKFDYISGNFEDYKLALLDKNNNILPVYKDKIVFYTKPYLDSEFLGFVLDGKLSIVKQSPLRFLAVRKAINYAIDRNKIVKYLKNNFAVPAYYGIIPDDIFPKLYNCPEPAYTYDPQKALFYLAEAGLSQWQKSS